MKLLAVDCGGTRIKLGLVEDRILVADDVVEAHSSEPMETCLAAVADCLERMCRTRAWSFSDCDGKENPELHFNSSLAKQTGTRIVTAPVPLTVDGELYRYVSVAAQPGGKLQGRIQLPGIKAGARTIRLGAHEIKIP